jgi:hypothetical protein
MKLHSILFGWTEVLTKPCVSPQVFHGGMRLAGWGPWTPTARGVEPSRQCSQPGSLKAGTGARIGRHGQNQMNARKHRDRESSHTRLFKARAKRHAVESGLSNVARRALTRLPVYRADLNLPVLNAEHGNAAVLGHAGRGRPNRKAGISGAALGRPKKPKPGCNAADMPTSVRSSMARKQVEPPLPGKANDERRPSLSASRSCCHMEHSVNGHRRVLPSCLRGLRCVPVAHRILSGSGSPRTGLALARLEPCEGKLSRTVLRGAWAG